MNQSKQTFFSAHLRLITAQINAPSIHTGLKSAFTLAARLQQYIFRFTFLSNQNKFEMLMNSIYSELRNE